MTVAVALAAVLWEAGIVAGWAATGRFFAPTIVVGSVVTGVTFVVCGLLAYWRSAFPRMGVVMLIAGALWMLEDLSTVRTDGTLAAFQFTSGTSAAGFAFLVLAFPTGRLRGRADRTVVLAAGVISFVLTPLTMITQYRSTSCPDCGQRPLTIRNAHAVSDVGQVVAQLLGVGAVVATVVLLLHRWVTGTRPARRMTAPFLVVAALIALVNLEKVIDPSSGFFENVRSFLFALVPLAFLLGLSRLRMVRVGITALVSEIGQAPTLTRLRDVLRQTLGDRRIAIRTWDAEAETWRDEAGGPLPVAAAGDGLTATPIDARDGSPLGLLAHDPALAYDPELLEAVVGAIRVALENNALHDELGVQLARAADAADGERRRVARDLHDGAQQRLVGLMLDAAALEQHLGDDADERTRELLSALNTGAQASLTELRRLVQGLAPPTLAEEGLGNAVRELTMTLPVGVIVEDRLPGRFPPAVESAAFLLVSEALANVTKHAGARVARVRLEQRGDTLHIAVADDGRGGADFARGTGMRGMRERAAALGGHIVVTSPTGRGTTVGIELPARPGARGRTPAPT